MTVGCTSEPTRIEHNLESTDMNKGVVVIKELIDEKVEHEPSMRIDQNTHSVIRKIHEDSHTLNVILEDEPFHELSLIDSGVDPILLPNKGK